MWKWLQSLFRREPKQPLPPRLVEVGRADVHIVENDGTVHDIYFEGEYYGEHPFEGDWINDAEFYVRAWQARCGTTGTAGIGGGQFVPVCNVKRITVKYSELKVEAKQ